MSRSEYLVLQLRTDLSRVEAALGAERDDLAKLRAELAACQVEIAQWRMMSDEWAEEGDILRQALVTISRTGMPGGAIATRDSDGHACAWCRGQWIPCPAEVARQALEAAKETR